jgi:hypothetical protein
MKVWGNFVALLLVGSLLIGCQEEQPQYTQATISIYDSPTYNYDSVFVSITQSGDTLWQSPLTSTEGYYRVVVYLSPGIYSARGWAYAQGLRCFFTNFSTTFSLADKEQKLVTLNLDPQKPSAPYDLDLPTVTNSSILSVWSHSGELISGFKIERTPFGQTAPTIISVPASVRGYQNTGLAPNTWYYFHVKAFNPAGESQASNLDSARTN